MDGLVAGAESVRALLEGVRGPLLSSPGIHISIVREGDLMQMDEGALRWLHRTASKNFWRVCHWYEYEDLIQDGHWHWARLMQRYPDATPPHIMSLFKITFTNHLNDLSKRHSSTPEILASQLQVGPPGTELMDVWDRLVASEQNEQDLGPLGQTLARAPEPIAKVLRLFGSEEGRAQLRAPYRRYSDGTRETLNDRLTQLTGIETDFRAYFKAFLTTG